MKKLSVLKRMVAFICALVMALGVGLHARPITAQADQHVYTYHVWGPGYDCVGRFNTFEELEAQLMYDLMVKGGLTQEKACHTVDWFRGLYSDGTWVDGSEYRYGEHGATWFPGYGWIEPDYPKQPSDIARKKAEDALKVRHPLIEKTGTKLILVDVGEWNSLKKDTMAKVARQVKDGYSVAIFSRVDKKDRVTLIPAGTAIDLSQEWYGPEYLSATFSDITDAYKAQDKSLSKFLRVKNIIDGK